MQEIMLITGLFVVGVGTGAVLRYARDRKLLCLYGHLVEDLSRMIPRRNPDSPETPAAQIANMTSVGDAQQQRAS